MLRCMRSNRGSIRQSSYTRCVLPVACAVLVSGVGGCSADVTRFDGTALGASQTTTGSIGRGYESSNSSLSEQTPSREYAVTGLSRSQSSVRSNALPYAPQTNTMAGRIAPPAILNTPRRSEQPMRVADASPFGDDRTLSDAGTSAGTVIVRAGDTLYGIARSNNVSVAAIKQANGLTSDVIQPGQALSMPGASNTVTRAAPRSVPVRTRQPSIARAPIGGGAGSYTVQPGDSLYRISQQTGVPVSDLKSINGISDVRSLQPGQVLNLGQQDTGRFAAAPPREIPTTRQVSTRSINVPPVLNQRQGTMSDVSRSPRPRAGDRVASVSPAPKTPATRSSSGFRWPARGRILYGYGPRPDGSHNDGIDIEVPMGAEIRSAADGVVAYADDELEAYGNLVLIRHDNGWVSAYAHADRLLVKRGDTVQRGQVIAKAGKTGAVDRPTLHFELRDGSKPVDPMPHLPKG